MTDEEREAKKAEINDEIERLNAIADALENCRKDIETAKTTLEESVVDPIKNPAYDLSEEDKWRGLQYNEACNMVATIGTNLDTYKGSVETLLNQIETAMSEIAEKIAELYKELATL